MREVQERLGFTSERTLIEAIRMGSISHLPITIKDVEETLSTLGRHPATIMGKAQTSTRPHVPIVEIPRFPYKEVTLHIDIMFVENQPYLISVSELIDLTIVNFLDDSSTTWYSKSEIPSIQPARQIQKMELRSEKNHLRQGRCVCQINR